MAVRPHSGSVQEVVGNETDESRLAVDLWRRSELNDASL
jgi:hypothetical protein